MKSAKLLSTIAVVLLFFTSCIQDDYYIEPPVAPISLEILVTDYELWYVDYHSTTGTGDVPFMSIAFTMSFINGRLYANNNLVDIGYTGNGFGIPVGFYDTYDIYSTCLLYTSPSPRD